MLVWDVDAPLRGSNVRALVTASARRGWSRVHWRSSNTAELPRIRHQPISTLRSGAEPRGRMGGTSNRRCGRLRLPRQAVIPAPHLIALFSAVYLEGSATLRCGIAR